MKIDTQLKTLVGIYCIENTVNGKKYIGSSTNIYQRGLKHRSQLRSISHPNKKLQNSYNKHEEKNFIFYVVELCLKKDLIRLEQHYIDFYLPFYNLMLQVERKDFSAETKLQISNSLKKRYREGLSNNCERKVNLYTVTGEYIRTYDSITKCSKDIKADLSNVKRVLRGRLKTCKGFKITYHNS
jgi:hypothetical protein